MPQLCQQKYYFYPPHVKLIFPHPRNLLKVMLELLNTYILLYSKCYLHIEEIPDKSCDDCRSSPSPDILKCEEVNEPIGDKEDDHKGIKRNRQKSHIAMSKFCRRLKCPSSVGKKCSDRFEHKGYRRSQEIMHIPESDKIPDEYEIQYEHNGPY